MTSPSFAQPGHVTRPARLKGGRKSRACSAYVLANESIIIFPVLSVVMWNW